MDRKLRMGPACYHVLHVIPPAVAHELNLFWDEGLRDEYGSPTYELVKGSHAPFMFEKVALAQSMKEHSVDVCMDVKPSTVAYLQTEGHDLHIIAGWRNQMPDYIVGRPGIDSLRALRGRRIGVIDKTDIIATMLSYWLAEDGVDPQTEVEWVRGVDPRIAERRLREGYVDAAMMSPIEAAPLLKAEELTLLLDIKKQYPKGRPDRVIAATGRAIREQPEQLTAFMKGMIRAYWFVRDPENTRVVRQMERRLRRESTDMTEPTRELVFASPEHAEQMPFPFDGLPTGLDQYLEEAVSLGTLDSAPDVEQLCKLDVTRAAYAELSTRDDVREDLERARVLASRMGY